MSYQVIKLSNGEDIVCRVHKSKSSAETNKLKIPNVSAFYPFMKSTFINNYDKILSFIELNEDIDEISKVAIYSMNTIINYKKLKDKFVETKTKLLIDFDL